MDNVSEEELKEVFGEDKDSALFFVEWINSGLNAFKAYKKLHPNVTDTSARVLGAKQLANINISHIYALYGLTLETYFEQLKLGLNALKFDETGNKVPDFRVRKQYMDLLAPLLGIISTDRGLRNQFAPITYVPPSWYESAK